MKEAWLVKGAGFMHPEQERLVRVKYLLVFQFPFLDRYSHSIFHFRVF